VLAQDVKLQKTANSLLQLLLTNQSLNAKLSRLDTTLKERIVVNSTKFAEVKDVT
jgi:hypothetical protein